MEQGEKIGKDKSVGKLIGQAARLWRKVADQRLQPYGLTEATWLPLLQLSKTKTPLRQKELAQALSLDGSSVVRLIDSLEGAGLARRCEESSDRRAKEIRLTPKGDRTVEELQCVALAIADEALEGLRPEDVEAARRVLKHICDHFERELGEQAAH